MTATYVLYDYWRSSSSWRVRWAMHHKGIAHTTSPVNLLKSEHTQPDHIAKNPAGTVPVLEVSSAAGDSFFLSESVAILEWLEETHPLPPLLPASAYDRAIVRQMVETINAGTQPLQNLKVQRAVSEDKLQQQKWAARWIQSGLATYERMAACHAGTYSFGGQLTLADLFLIPQLYNAARFDVDTSQFANISRIQRNCLALDACQKAAPENQPSKP